MTRMKPAFALLILTHMDPSMHLNSAYFEYSNGHAGLCSGCYNTIMIMLIRILTLINVC